MYRILAYLKSLRRRWLARGNLELRLYSNPEAVGGWRGWYEVDGEVVAFLNTENETIFVW